MTRFASLVVAVATVGCGTYPSSKSDIDPTEPTELGVSGSSSAMDYVGIVYVKRSKVLVTAFAGRIDEVRARPSQLVHKDDVVATQDTTELRFQLDKARAEEAAARASARRSSIQASMATMELRVTRALVRAGAAPVRSIDQNSFKVGEANESTLVEQKLADAHAAEAAQIENKIDHAVITAPFDGVLSTVRVKDGDAVPAGATVTRILDPSDLIVRFAIPMTDTTEVSQGMQVRLDLPNRDPVWAVVTEITDEIEPPISFRIAVADIDDSKLPPGSIRLISVGRVTIASAVP